MRFAIYCMTLSVLLQWQFARAYEPEPQPAAELSSIMNGVQPPLGSYPWMAALLQNTTSGLPASELKFCGGSLIAPEWVLTAAHCVDSMVPQSISVLVGRDILDDTKGELHSIDRIIVNPRYDVESLTADVAMLHLTTNSRMAPVSLPLATDGGRFAGLTSTMLGWGSFRGRNALACELNLVGAYDPSKFTCKTFVFKPLNQSKYLRSANAQVMANTSCNSRLEAFLQSRGSQVPVEIRQGLEVFPGTLCVADPVGNTSPCYGDSGGPLLVDLEGKSVVAGIASFVMDRDCAGENHLSFYTEVADYLEFIISAMTTKMSLTFDQLCPPPAKNLKLQTGQVIKGKSEIRLSWSAAPAAKRYDLVFSQLPLTNKPAGRIAMPVTSTEFTASLDLGTHYLVSIQAMGEACDSALSESLEVYIR